MPSSLSLDPDKELFVALSVELTGFSRFELFATGQIDAYYVTAASSIGPHAWRNILDVADSWSKPGAPDPATLIERHIYRRDNLRAATQRILMLWYTGTWFDTVPFGGAPVSAQSYIEGLVWRAIASHPMAARPQGFAAWSEPPPVNPLSV
jgi:hypothetical protein